MIYLIAGLAFIAYAIMTRPLISGVAAAAFVVAGVFLLWAAWRGRF